MKNLLCLLMLLSFKSIGQKTLEAYRTNQPVTIDGHIDEADWSKAMIATDFFTTDPVPGLKPKQKTKVRVLYDDVALYVSADMEEVARDSIMTQLSLRDNLGNTDAFGVFLDTYNNGSDGVALVVAATGVQYDALKSNDGDEDGSWDAVWESEVNLTAKGWSCEMRIPYSAIRFPKAEAQEWTINFIRSQQHLRQTQTWTNIDPAVDGVFTQSGKLTNIKNIEPPLRLQFSPYLTTYATHFHDKESNPVNSTGYTYSAGMDVKYGLNDAFTLDMTLIPDFGQVEADDLVVNLSPFEVELSEKRPFFTEGLELFSKADIFYTRRIGGTALNFYDVEDQLNENEEIESNPQIPQLYNATKVSGRTKSGLGIGVFNAVEAPTDATIISTENPTPRKERTQPLTNYSVIVFDQNLPNNSNVALINTNVWRKGAEFYDANVIGTEFNLKDKNQKYSINGSGSISNQMFADTTNNVGHTFEINFEKISGNFKYYTGYEELSKNYNPNDLGFLNNANERYAEVGVEYSFFKPIWKFNRLNLWFDVENTYLYDPSVYTNTHFNWGFWGQTKKFWNLNMWFNYSTDKKDYFEPRTDDFSRYVIRPVFYNGGFWVGSDFRKKFRISLNGNLYNINEENRWGYFLGVTPRYRFSDKLSMDFSYRYNIQYDDTGWIGDRDDEIYIGQRDVRNVTSLINMSYIFNSKMGLNLRTRHDWFVAAYNSYHLLGAKGELLDTEFRDELDFSNSFFSVDFGFNWRFAPGSDLNVVWKNNIAGDKTDPLINYKDRSYADGVKALGDFPQQNSLSIRLTYFVDQVDVRERFGKR